MLLSASSAFSALLSCSIPITALSMTISRISPGSKNSIGSPSVQATTNETAAAASRMRIITSLNWSRNRRSVDFFFFSRSRFSPYSDSRAVAVSPVRPVFGSAPSVCSTDSVLSLWYAKTMLPPYVETEIIFLAICLSGTTVQNFSGRSLQIFGSANHGALVRIIRESGGRNLRRASCAQKAPWEYGRVCRA